MTKAEMQARLDAVATILADGTLDTEVRTLAGHVLLQGWEDWTEIEYSDLRRLLRVRDEKKLRRIVDDIDSQCPQLEVLKPAGRRRNPKFRIAANPGTVKNTALDDQHEGSRTVENTAPEDSRTVENAALENARTVENTAPGPRAVKNTVPSPRAVENTALDASPRARAFPYPEEVLTTSSPPPPPTAREDDPKLEQLGNWLHGDDVVDRFNCSAPHSATWPASIWGSFGPSGRYLHECGVDKHPDQEHPAIVAKAMSDYADDGQAYKASLFRGYVKKAARNHNPTDSTTTGDRNGNQDTDPLDDALDRISA